MTGKLLLVKHSNKEGSVAIDTSLFHNFVDIYSYLSAESLGSFIQVVVVKGIESYKEYYPVKYMEDTSEFIINTLTEIKNNRN